ncbi:hypothetical protein [Dyella sp. GSA-30]|uniref:hypothetical protein n=1 Tax=Dyella sp. GSA-30 TaxID=2994496 RepID=UPI002491EF25|nr:hypothetical protein [Dyella sp. GSA-30]
MAEITWNPNGNAQGGAPSPVVWGCQVFMREDGTLETYFEGQTGLQMMGAAINELHAIERLRREPAYDFGAGRQSNNRPDAWS